MSDRSQPSPPEVRGTPPTSLHRRELLRIALGAGTAGLVAPLLAGCEPGRTVAPLNPGPALRGRSFVGGPEAVVGQGGWCWFQSPRASFGPNGMLWLGSTVANTATTLDGSVQATAFDTTTMKVRLRRNLGKTRPDDHTSPSVLALGDRVQFSWTLHQRVDYLEWGEMSLGGILVIKRLRRPEAVVAPGRGMAYASAHVVDGQRWLLYRGEQFSWNLLTSPDGVTWTARGLVVAPATAGDRPYLQAVSDGTRLHIVVSDGNPTEFRGTSVSAGTVGTDLQVRDRSGRVVGSVGRGAPPPRRLTRLLAGKVGADETLDVDHWLSDLQFIDGNPTATLTTRDPWPAGSQTVGRYRHRYWWARRRATGWVVEPLGWAGAELFSRQPDYCGLAAQDPSDARRVVVSTNVHPASGDLLVSAADGKVHWELFEGYRVAEGTWTWTPLTTDSTRGSSTARSSTSSSPSTARTSSRAGPAST